MSSPSFKEYRCACGKLLFKGLLCQCLIEVKCRRCSVVTTWGTSEAVSYALVECDASARMTEASGDISSLLGYDHDSLIGRPITELFPLLHDAPADDGNGYTLRRMPFMLRDGREQLVESCIVSRRCDGIFAGYRVFSVPVSSND